MLVLTVLILIISFFLALWSVINEHSDQDLARLAEKYRQNKIKGTIMIEKGKEPKHYSSYS
jgi:thioredoxin-related protein